jgi:hypothetical protein
METSPFTRRKTGGQITAVKELSRQFDHFLELNFEEQREISRVTRYRSRFAFGSKDPGVAEKSFSRTHTTAPSGTAISPSSSGSLSGAP